MQWNGQTKAQFRDTLCHVYRTPVDLEMFVVERDFCRSLADLREKAFQFGKIGQHNPEAIAILAKLACE